MSVRSIWLRLACLSLLAALFVASPVFAWGCKGHQTVALIAEKHLAPEVRQLLETLLKENPIDRSSSAIAARFPAASSPTAPPGLTTSATR